MKKQLLKRILPLVVLPLICGCAEMQRPLTDAALGAGGAYLGDQLSDGNPAAIAAGAAGGVLLGEGVNALRSRTERNAYTDGYTTGRADGVKRLYWGLQNQQQSQPEPAAVQTYEVTIPEHFEDGVLVQRSTRVIRIQE